MPDIFTSDKEPSQPRPYGRRSIEEQTALPKPEVLKTQAVRGAQRSQARGTKKEIPHGSPMHPLAAFAIDPLNVHFATQGEDERVHLFLRRHFITNLTWIALSILLLLTPPVLVPLFGGALPFASLLIPNVLFVLTLFYYVIVFGTVILASFINWYFNVYIVTNERVIDVDFVNILYREVSATRLNLIQDVTTKTGGVIRAIFNYGDVFIQTAGNEANFDFHAVPKPQEVAREIEKLMEQARKEEGASELEEALEK